MDFAATNGHHKVVKRLLAASTPELLNSTNFARSTALHLAAEKGHDKVVALLLATTPLILDAVERWGNNALQLAASYGHDKVVKHLLAVMDYVSISHPEIDGMTALHLAAVGGHSKVVSQLLATNANLENIVDFEGWTPLHWAINYDHEAVAVQLLVNHPPIIASHVGDTALHLSMERSHFTRLTPLLWQMYPNAMRVPNNEGFTPFAVAVRNDNEFAIELVQWKLPIDKIVKDCVLGSLSYERFRPVLEKQCEALAIVLNQDVLGTVFEYLGFDYIKQPQRKKSKLGD